jgi:DNA sulfur modification protein DndB
MWTFRLMRQISIFDEKELPPELRAQRVLNKARIPEIAEYILDNPKDYVFSAITASIDSQVKFVPFSDQPGADKLGTLIVPMDAKFIINDGQHRRAAILEALEQRPDLAHETIPVVFFLDIGLSHCQQMFADLNRYAIRPSRSLGLLYDHRNARAGLANMVIMKSDLFRELVDFEKSSLSRRSRKLFTLSAFFNACADLVEGIATGEIEEDARVARDFWERVAKLFPVWQQVRDGKVSAGEVREGFIHTHGIALQSIGRAGNALLQSHPADWFQHLHKLGAVDWSRRNPEWEGRAMLAGRLAKTESNVLLTTSYLKRRLGLALSTEEAEAESIRPNGSTERPSLAPETKTATSKTAQVFPMRKKAKGLL